MSLRESRESILKYLEEVEARANAVAGPTYKPEDKDAFQVQARADIPTLIRAVKAALSVMECQSCGVELHVVDVMLRTMKPGAEKS